MDAKKTILETFQLTLENGWYWQRKENMSPWKVFSETHFKEKTVLWLIFRVHKLCNAKYRYFSKHIDEWQAIAFGPDEIYIVEFKNGGNWVLAEGFKHHKTGKFIGITKLQKIRDKDVFIDWIETITSNKFPVE